MDVSAVSLSTHSTFCRLYSGSVLSLSATANSDSGHAAGPRRASSWPLGTLMYPVRNSSFPRSVCCHPYVRTSCPLIDVASSRMVCPDFFNFFQIFGSVYSRTTVTLIAVNSTGSSVSCTFLYSWLRNWPLSSREPQWDCPPSCWSCSFEVYHMDLCLLLWANRHVAVRVLQTGLVVQHYPELVNDHVQVCKLPGVLGLLRVSTATLPVGPAPSSSDSIRAR